MNLKYTIKKVIQAVFTQRLEICEQLLMEN